MERFLGQEGWLFRFLDRLWDLIVLNVLFIITCIPLFTVGAAISALYTVTMKGVRKEDSYIVRSYLSAFKENFKKSTILWLLMIAVWGVLLIDIFVIGKNNSALIAMGGCFGVFWLLITLFAFQLQYNTACRHYGYGSAFSDFFGSSVTYSTWLVLFFIYIYWIFWNCLG